MTGPERKDLTIQTDRDDPLVHANQEFARAWLEDREPHPLAKALFDEFMDELRAKCKPHYHKQLDRRVL